MDLPVRGLTSNSKQLSVKFADENQKDNKISRFKQSLSAEEHKDSLGTDSSFEDSISPNA